MYIVSEIQTNDDGTVGILNTQHTTRPEAESKYYSVLAAAAISAVPTHACALMTNEGFLIMSQHYKHAVTQSAEPEGEAETSET